MNKANPVTRAHITGEINYYDDYSSRTSPFTFFNINTGISKATYLPYLILLTGIIFLLILLSTIYPGVFFSGDGGLKFLIIEQLQYTSEYKSIYSGHAPWVKEIWGQGYYPFKPAFVYTVHSQHLVAYPVIFQFVNYFFYKSFGFYGLYIIPATSVLLIWTGFIRILKVLKVSTPAIALGIFLLIFCTPLTFYAAVYWEHSLAAFLVFNGVIYFLQKKPSIAFAVIRGLLCGMAVWFREETIVLLGLLVLTIGWNSRKSIQKADVLFTLGAGFSVFCYFLFNYQAYGAMFGVHSYQVIRDMSVSQQLWKGVKQFFKMNASELITFPIICIPIFVLLHLFYQHKEKNNRLFQLALVVFLFILITPFIVPSDGDKQWGVRFFLPVVPAAILVTALFADQNNWLAYLRKNKGWALLLLLMVIYSAYLNVYKAGTTLKNDYSQRVLPALQYINNEPCKNIVIDNQYIAQELTTKFSSRNFFLVNNAQEVTGLMDKLKNAGQRQCIFISMDKEQTSFPQSLFTDKNISWQKTGTYDVGIYKFP